MSSEKYDFIIIGAGPSGCALASRLSRTPSAPSVLLLEAGGHNNDPSYRVPADRFTLAFREPSMNWGYKTVPQPQLKGQEIDYSRGRGLGGSSSINFSCWVIGPGADYNEWARQVGDESWNWENVKQRLKKIESYHDTVPEEHRKYVNPKPEDHGTQGPINLSYADPWERGLTDVFEAAKEVGMGVNPDVNSGDPIGFGMGPGNVFQGERTTAADYLKNPPSNLTIMVNSPAAKIVFEYKKATGIETIDGRIFQARNEVLLSLGALNTPQLLMLSGIGPASELQKHGIEVKLDMPEVGQNLQDHCFSTATLLRQPGTDDRSEYEKNAEIARKKWLEEKDKSGLMGTMHCSVPMGWFKSTEVLESEEFKALDQNTRDHVSKPTVPIFEVATHIPPLFVGDHDLQPTDSYLTTSAFVMNPQSKGEVTLNSADPKDAPKIDPKLLSHPFDRRVLIEGMRRLMKFLEAPALKKTTIKKIGCPKSLSDEDILDHCAGNLFSSWHMCSTVRMGSKNDKGACVDTDFRVRGIDNLRVADMSVLPFLTNNHTQSTAYLVGETAAEKIIKEYGLDGTSSRK